jgi:hypothetical protein
MRANGIHSDGVVNNRIYPEYRTPSIWYRLGALCIVMISGAVSIALTLWVIVVIVFGIWSYLA